MKITVSSYDFERAFADAGRMDQFSYEGRAVLFAYLEELEQSIGEELELDVAALCCDYYEDTASNIARNYSLDLSDLDAEDDDYLDQCIAAVREYLMDNGAYVGEVASGFVYSAF